MRSLFSFLLTSYETVGVCLSFPIGEAMSQGALRGCELRFLEMRLSSKKWGMPLAVAPRWGELGGSPTPMLRWEFPESGRGWNSLCDPSIAWQALNCTRIHEKLQLNLPPTP